MRILNVASLSPIGVPQYRLQAMRRLGHEVVAFDTDAFVGGGGRAARWVRERVMIGPAIARLNRRLAAAAAAEAFDLIWLDKPIHVRRATVERLNRSGAITVSYNPDNPFGPRRDPGWRLFRAAVPAYRVHVAANPASLDLYRAAGVAHVFLMPVPYEPTVHYPPPPGWSDRERTCEVSFIGSPYDERAAFVRALWTRHGIRVRVRGNGWRRHFDRAERRLFLEGGPLYGDAYREAIWRAKINLGFVTRANLDTYAQRWFEIAGSAGFMLNQRTDDGLAAFAADREAAYFADVEECAAMIRKYLPDEAARERIARAGHARAVASGYDNDSRLARLFDEIRRSWRA